GELLAAGEEVRRLLRRCQHEMQGLVGCPSEADATCHRQGKSHEKRTSHTPRRIDERWRGQQVVPRARMAKRRPDMAVKKIPDGHNSVSPYLIVNGAERALDFYARAFGATELFRHNAPDGKVGHAEVRIGDTVIMIADEFPDH